ncbi:MAG: methyltransferase [bacterium]|jgi:tRNA1Val (adenine37-N6)-methyltransferase
MPDPELFLDRLRPSIETHLLARFVKPEPEQTLLEAGCGNGYISLYLAFTFPGIRQITALDLNQTALEEAQVTRTRFQQQFTAPLAPIHFEQQDIRTFSASCPYDLMVCNPPFFPQHASRPSPDPQRQQARQDITLTTEELFSAAQRLVKPQASLYLVFPSCQLEICQSLAEKFLFQIIRWNHHPEIRKRNGGIHLVQFTRRKE